MADTGAVLGMTAGGIAFVNQFIVNEELNFRIVIATPLAGLVLHAIGTIPDMNPIATGLGLAMLVTVFMVPIGASQTPLQTLNSLLGVNPETRVSPGSAVPAPVSVGTQNVRA